MPQVRQIFSLAFARTALILFKPFSIKKWLPLLLIAFSAGTHIVIGNSCTFMPRAASGYCGSRYSDGKIKTQKLVALADSEEPYVTAQISTIKEEPLTMPSKATIIVIAVILLIIMAPIGLVCAWINARFRFIFYDAIVNNHTKLALPWTKYEVLGNSYFRFTLFALLGSLGVFLLYLALVLGILAIEGVFATGLSLISERTIGAAALILLAIYTPFAVCVHFVGQFVVPIMAIDNEKVLPSIKQLIAAVKANPRPFLIYLPIGALLGIGGLLAQLILAIMLLIVLGIAAAVVFCAQSPILGEPLSTIAYAIIASGPPALLAFYIVLLGSLPIPVFFRSFTLYYIGAVLPQYNAFRGVPPELPPHP